MGEIMCTHCRKKGEISLCKLCYSKLAASSTWNAIASQNEMFSSQYLEILEILHKLTIKISNLELQLNLAKKLKLL